MGMGLGMAELPLALFSTLVPMGAGAFTLLLVAFITRKFDADQLKKIDKMTLIPALFVIVGFVCAFFHLANAGHAMNVFNNVGSSPMSNEIVCGIVFCVVALVYWIVALATKMSGGLRRVFCAIVAILGLIFCIFIGLAYSMDTIPSWSNAMVPLSTLCFGLLGGAAVGMTMLYSAGVDVASEKSFKTGALVISWIGAIGSALFFCIQMGMTSGMQNNMMLGSDLVGAMLPWIITAVIVILLTGIALMFEITKKRAGFYAWIVVIVAFIGILIARLCFYGVELSVGLSI